MEEKNRSGGWRRSDEPTCRRGATSPRIGSSVKAKWLRCVLLLVGIVPLPVQADNNNVEVDLKPWPAPTITQFDPTNPPPDLKQGEDGDATVIVELAGNFVALWDPTSNTLRVTSVKIIVEGRTDIRLPNNADQNLKDHENGHDTLSKNEYETKVKKKIQNAFRQFVGMKFKSKGATVAERMDDVGRKADAELNSRTKMIINAIKKQINTINEKFDKLTDHGRGKATDPKSGKHVDTKTGVAVAIAERDKAPAAGTRGSSPNPKKPSGGTALDPTSVFFDPSVGSLGFGGDLLLKFAWDPTDAILGRGQVKVDPILLIGPQENGKILLSDTTLQIIDVRNGALFMDGFVFELVFMSSSLPGLAGMVQGFLAIPPDFAGGINNTINSDFLPDMQAASSVGEPTTFWFFADQPMFDGRGSSLIENVGVTGALKFGVAAVTLSSDVTAQFTLRQQNPGVADDQLVEVAAFTLPAGGAIDPVSEDVKIELAESVCSGTFSSLSLPVGSFTARAGGKIFLANAVVTDRVSAAPVTAAVRITREGEQDFKMSLDFKTADHTCLEGTDNRNVATIVTVGDDTMLGIQCFERLPDGDLFFPPGPDVVCP